MDQYCIALDVGGTSIKSAIVSSCGELLQESYLDTPIDSKGTATQILQTFSDPVTRHFDFAAVNKFNIAGIGIGMPGPFDYENGVSLHRGVKKYEAIFGLNVKNELAKRLHLKNDVPVVFENDGWTFVRGEAWQGAAKGFHRVIGLTLGTGLGSGFMVDEQVVDSGPGVPPEGWFSGLPYKDGIIDDYVSKRAIVAKYLKKNPKTIRKLEVKEIAELAENGNAAAVGTFAEIGSLLGKLLRPVAQQFRPECIVVGGKIAYSYDMFAPYFKKELTGLDSVKKISRAQNIEFSGILGAAHLLFKKARVVL